MPSLDIGPRRLTAFLVAATFGPSGPSYTPPARTEKRRSDWAGEGQSASGNCLSTLQIRLARDPDAAAPSRPPVCIGDEPRRDRATHAVLLRKALRLPPGIAEARVIDLLWHTPTGVIDRRATPTVAAAVPGTIATLQGAGLEASGPAGRQQQGALQGGLRGRHRPHRPRVLPRRAEVHPAPAARGQHPLRQRAHRGLQRQEADAASGLYRRPGGARGAADAGAGLSADRGPLRQGAAQSHAGRAGAGAGAARMAGQVLAGAEGLARPRRRGRAAAPARRCGGCLPGVGPLAAARLRRAAGGAAGARPGAAELQAAAGPRHRGRRPHPRAGLPMRCPSPSPARSARR